MQSACGRLREETIVLPIATESRRVAELKQLRELEAEDSKLSGCMRTWRLVAALIRSLRVRYATGIPASPSLRIATICDSVNGDFFIGLPSGVESCRKSPVHAVPGLGKLSIS